MSKVALMCGHGKSANGSWDSGTTYGGYTEAGLMLPITRAAVAELRKRGVTVISDADTGNNKNMLVDVAWANREKCDIYVSVHCDWYKAASGVYPLYVSAAGKRLATALNNAISKGMPMKSRGVCKRTDLWELNGTDMPACILETGSIKADITILRDHSVQYGKLIADGICDYLGIKAGQPQVTLDTEFTAGYTNRDLVAYFADYFAYKKNTEKANVNGGKPRPSYKTALDTVFPPKTRKSWSKGPRIGASCDVFVATVLRFSGVDKKCPRGVDAAYLAKSAKYKEVKVTAKTIKDGDIICCDGHICIHVGGKIKEAASGGKALNYQGRFYPKTTNTLSARLKGARVFRVK